MEYGKRLNPERSLRTPKGIKGTRQKVTVTYKMAPPSIQKFDPEDTGKLVAIVAASEMAREYLIKQKILPDHINV